MQWQKTLWVFCFVDEWNYSRVAGEMQFLWHAVQQNLKAILFTKEQPLLCRWVEWDLHLHTCFFKFSWVLNLFKPSTCVNFSRIRVWVHITIHTRFIEDLHHLTQSDGAVLMPHTQAPPCIFTGQGLYFLIHSLGFYCSCPWPTLA